MSNLEELIEKLCPDGVEYKYLADVVTIKRGVRLIKKELKDKAKYPVYQNSLIPLGYYDDYNCEANKTLIITAGAAGDIVYSNTKFWAADDCFYFICNRYIDDKFLYYVLMSQQRGIYSKVRKASIPRLPRIVIEKIKLPVPPLEVQREIVRILDNFAIATTEIQQKLQEELAARQKQYEYYRDKLLTPKAEIKTVELGEVCTFVRGPFGGALKKEIFKPHGYAVYEQQHAIYRTLDFRYFIDKKKFDELKRFSIKPGDMIVSCSGTIGKTFIIPEDAPEGVINQALLKLTPHDELNVFYLQYFFENTISKELNGVARGGAIKNVPSVSELKAIKIPVPSLDVQERLVQVLDNFDAICSDLNIGLPAEIEARQKQYEYYRDKLLTFKELKKEA